MITFAAGACGDAALDDVAGVHDVRARLAVCHDGPVVVGPQLHARILQHLYRRIEGPAAATCGCRFNVGSPGRPVDDLKLCHDN